ncbi:MAG: hypothetical protein KAG28_08895 [Cocleimonas sp.]|nr:hypothetical protein [Cocleimonas sp.]
MSDYIFKQLNKIEGLSAVSILSEMGEVILSSIKVPQTNEFLGFLLGIGNMLSDDTNLGKMHHILLKSPRDETILLHFSEQYYIAALLSCPKSSPIISKKIETILKHSTLSYA